MEIRDELINELLEENYDIVDIVNVIWERDNTSDLELCEALVGIMTDKEVKKVLAEIEENREVEEET